MAATKQLNPPTESTITTETLTDRLGAALSAKVGAYAARPVAPGATREELIDSAKPWAAITAVVLAASAAKAGLDASEADAAIAVTVAVAAFAAAVVLGFVARRRLLCAKRRTRVYAFLGAAATWVTATLATGVTQPMVFLLAVVGVGLSLWHWADRRLGYNWHPPVKLAAPVADEPQVDVYAHRWKTNLAGAGKVLAGTALADPERIPGGVRYALSVVPGTHPVDEVNSHMAKIKNGLGLRQSHRVLIEEHPTLDPPTLLVTIINVSPVDKGIGWPGAKAMLSDGSIWIGRYIDGNDDVTWSLYGPDRIHNGFIAGSTGSGKSRLLENIAKTAAVSEQFPTAVWYADGQRGGSSPNLMKYSDYAAGSPEGVLALLEQACHIIDLQLEENLANGDRGFRPTPERPGLLVILDECKKVLSQNENPSLYLRTQAAAAKIATTGNKTGVGIILAGQEGTLPTLGGAGDYPQALRNNLQAGNGVLMKTDESAAGNIFGIPRSVLRTIPDGGGYGFVAGGIGTRRAMMRGFYDVDEIEDANMASIRWLTVSTMTAVGLGPAYHRRRETAAEDAAAARVRVAERRRRAEALLRGEPMDWPEPELTRMPEPRPAGSSFTSFVVPVPFWRRPAVPAPDLTDPEARVLRAVRSGLTGWQEIGAKAQLGRDRTYTHLNALAEKGLVVKAAHGEWQPAPVGVVA